MVCAGFSFEVRNYVSNTEDWPLAIHSVQDLTAIFLVIFTFVFENNDTNWNVQSKAGFYNGGKQYFSMSQLSMETVFIRCSTVMADSALSLIDWKT